MTINKRLKPRVKKQSEETEAAAFLKKLSFDWNKKITNKLREKYSDSQYHKRDEYYEQ